MNHAPLDLDAYREELVVRGFVPDGRPGSYRCGPHVVGVESTWVVISEETDGPTAASELGPLGTAGLWRLVPSDDGPPRRVFEIPVTSLGGGESGRGGMGSMDFGALLNWALSTSRGSSPDDWEAPSDGDLARWIPPQDLTVRAGSELRQGVLTREPKRLAIEFPVVRSLDGELPDPRQSWLQWLLADAQRTWRMVRFGTTADGARVEIDLTGAPRDSIEPLCRTALDALRWTVAWILPAAGFLADPAANSRALEILSPQGGLARPQPEGA